jgi:hypothetical protein
MVHITNERRRVYIARNDRAEVFLRIRARASRAALINEP